MSYDGFNSICPFMNASAPMCCSDDQVAIMVANFDKIDHVFGENVPMCGINLKKLWCEFTCSPRQADFVHGLGYKIITQDDGTEQNFTKISFGVDDSMSCTLFTSCKKVDLIASASVQSSIAFLDFLGVNGQN